MSQTPPRFRPASVEARFLLIAGLVVTSALFGYGFVVVQSGNWLPAFGQFVDWVRRPVLGIGALELPNWPTALAGTALAVSIGGLLAVALLPEDAGHASGMLLAYALLLGLSVAGYGTQLAAIFGLLHAWVPVAWMLAVGVAAGLVVRRRFGSLVTPFVRVRRSAPQPARPGWPGAVGAWLAGVAVIAVISFGFHALAFPVTEWDALIYHAGTPRLWYLDRPAPPVIAGPSVGIEMSYHYPGLLPGIAVFYYLLTGGVHDTYLSLASAAFGAVAIVLTYHAARHIAGAGAGSLAAGVLASTPLFAMYAAWPTAYMPLTALVAALLGCLQTMWSERARVSAVTVAILAGLAGNVSYLALYVLAFLALASLWFVRRRLLDARQAVLMALLALAIASPPYLRNLVRLGDPVFPLGYTIFRSPHVRDVSLLRDSLTEISNNALGMLGTDPARRRLRQIRVLLWDKNLLPVGSYAGLIGIALFANAARWRLALHATWIALLALFQLQQGWFWLRTLTMILPSLAIVSGVSLWGIITHRPSPHAGRVTRLAGRLCQVTAGALLVAISLFPGLTLAWAGPNQETWTTSLPPTSSFGARYRHIGRADEWLRHVYSGDYDAWQWVRQHLGRDGRVASYDNRWYYLGPGVLLYLDGAEAVPLYAIHQPAEIARFLRERNVRIILAPHWVQHGPSRFPALRRLPLYEHLGSPTFPLLATFRIRGTDHETKLYGVR